MAAGLGMLSIFASDHTEDDGFGDLGDFPTAQEATPTNIEEVLLQGRNVCG
jgi:hypothetical protein